MQVLDSLIDGPLRLRNRREGDELIGMIVRYLRTGEQPEPRTDAQEAVLFAVQPGKQRCKQTRKQTGKQNGKQTAKQNAEQSGKQRCKQTRKQTGKRRGRGRGVRKRD